MTTKVRNHPDEGASKRPDDAREHDVLDYVAMAHRALEEDDVPQAESWFRQALQIADKEGTLLSPGFPDLLLLSGVRVDEFSPGDGVTLEVINARIKQTLNSIHAYIGLAQIYGHWGSDQAQPCLEESARLIAGSHRLMVVSGAGDPQTLAQQEAFEARLPPVLAHAVQEQNQLSAADLLRLEDPQAQSIAAEQDPHTSLAYN